MYKCCVWEEVVLTTSGWKPAAGVSVSSSRTQWAPRHNSCFSTAAVSGWVLSSELSLREIPAPALVCAHACLLVFFLQKKQEESANWIMLTIHGNTALIMKEAAGLCCCRSSIVYQSQPIISLYRKIWVGPRPSLPVLWENGLAWFDFRASFNHFYQFCMLRSGRSASFLSFKGNALAAELLKQSGSNLNSYLSSWYQGRNNFAPCWSDIALNSY